MLTPDPSFCFWYITISLAQVLVLFLQSKLGSRFFVPRCLLPKPFDYYLDVPLIKHNTDEEEEVPYYSCYLRITLSFRRLVLFAYRATLTRLKALISRPTG